jgi:nitrite reductase (NADH) large subunit
MNMRYVIIGGSAAGIACVESIRELDKISTITLISEEEVPLYSRCLLSYLLAGAITEEGIYFKERDFFKENAVEAVLGVRAEHIDLKFKTVALSNKKKIDFDKLLIATGARSKMLKIPGIDKKGVFALRSINDERAIEEALKETHTAAVLGGGLIGLKAAYALKSRGVTVKVVVKSGQVLSQILDSKAAGIVQGRIE